ncbi:CpaD family pilus assembly protein [Methylobacterium sp. E-045]|uniref:CpaD family pilus assembly protein n=1 Tax=Methylobacterium sp. E-045 TaxID=2836575 RepID=UPI001FB91766|nr:CpaD family pilus assembly protein [Methylobacterium sp. E-045]MCJ2128620.1 CpaD family pilus assembly protein [Methylobacterium sp. E-045]
MSFPPFRSPAAIVASIALATALGACRADRAETTGSLYPADYRVRHPIVLADATRSLDVFVTGTGHIDPRQRAEIEAFLLEFRRYGRGTVILDMPRGVSPSQGGAVERTGAAIRRLAVDNGVGGPQMIVTGYAVADPFLAAPLRLSFQRMEAKVASQCGVWPQDLGVGSPAFSARNETHWNLGCAMQANIATQVADPVDLVRGRPEGRIDSIRRTVDINKLREGKDPSTIWRQDGKTSVKAAIDN